SRQGACTESGEKKADWEVGSEKSSQEKARCPSSASSAEGYGDPTRRRASCPGCAQTGVGPWRVAVSHREPVVIHAMPAVGRPCGRLPSAWAFRTDSRVSKIQNPALRGKAKSSAAPQHAEYLIFKSIT
ncbi:MAG: hypothetical protein ACXWUK_10450, partial [Burkholderiales bacterium]